MKEIPIEQFQVPTGDRSGVSVQSILLGEVPGVITDFLSLFGPAKHVEPGNIDCEVVWMFIGGKGVFSTKGAAFAVHDEAIARAPVGWSAELDVGSGESLLVVRIRKQLSDDDKAELAKHPCANSIPYFKRFADCPAYTEAIKSPKTVSRTLLPENIVPRMSVGTVYASGPDQVGRHRHPMLEQLFIGLRENNSTVIADGTKAVFPPFSALHVPLGSMHGTEVTKGHTLYYVWIDFFATKEGQEWLKVHKPIK